MSSTQLTPRHARHATPPDHSVTMYRSILPCTPSRPPGLAHSGHLMQSKPIMRSSMTPSSACYRHSGSKFCATPPRLHSKNVLKSNHGIIRSIFLRLLDKPQPYVPNLAAQQAIRISNYLYGSDFLSFLDMSNGFTRPILRDPCPTSQKLFKAQNLIRAKRMLSKIVRSKPCVYIPIAPGDLVEVFRQVDHEKREKWSSLRSVLTFDPNSWTVNHPSSSGRTINAAIEDILPAIVDDSFAALVRNGKRSSIQRIEVTHEARVLSISITHHVDVVRTDWEPRRQNSAYTTRTLLTRL